MKHNELKGTPVTRPNRGDRIALHDDIDDFGDDNAFRDDSGVDRIISAIDGDAERRDAEETARLRLMTDRLKKALLCLTPRQREYIELSFYKHKRDCEIQAIWGCNKQTVCEVKHSALKKLKKVMKSYAQPPEK